MDSNTLNSFLLPLEERCNHCGGKGWYSSEKMGRSRCGFCNGAGYVPTETGEAVLALMRHNFRPMLEDERG